MCTVKGTEDSGGEGIVSPHGIPTDLLDRCMIIKTVPYSKEEIKVVLNLRSKVEGLKLGEEALDQLAEKGSKTSLRYVLQTLTPASILSRHSNRPEITPEDVTELDDLFIDAKTSADFTSVSD